LGSKRCLNIPDGVTGAEADPLREGAVLLLLLSKDLLDLEGLVGGLKWENEHRRSNENVAVVISNDFPISPYPHAIGRLLTRF